MSKAAAIVFSLLALIAWGYFAWQDYIKDTTIGATNFVADEDVEPSVRGFGFYVLASNAAMEEGGTGQKPDEHRFALFAVIAFAFAVCYMAFSGGGAIFTMQFVVFVALLTAILHALIATAFLCLLAVRSSLMTAEMYDLAFYGLAFYALTTGVAAWVAMRNTEGMVRGRSDNTNAVMKALLVMFLVGAPLIAIETENGYRAFGYGLALPLAGLCLLSLLLIGVTRENFRYD